MYLISGFWSGLKKKKLLLYILRIKYLGNAMALVPLSPQILYIEILIPSVMVKPWGGD